MRLQHPEGDRGTLTARVYETLRDAIVSGELGAGSRHSIYELADVLAVSRTPVREALLKLADQGIVRFERNRGVVILKTTAEDLEEIFAVRLLLEVPATRRATQLMRDDELAELRAALRRLGDASVTPEHDVRERLRRDAQFHRVLLGAARNRRLVEMVDALRDLQIVRAVTTVGVTGHPEPIFRDHQEILRRVEQRDPAGAAEAMAAHIAGTARTLLGRDLDAVSLTEGLAPLASRAGD